MKKFMAIYMAPRAEFEKIMATSTPEDMEKGMEAWMQWSKEHAENLVDLGLPLGKTKRVTVDSITDVKNEIGGYTFVQAESHEAAAKLFDGHPHFQMQGGWIEVMECMPIEGM